MPKNRRTNPFEYLHISPDADTQEVIERGRELSFDASPEEKLLIRQAVLEITTHPLKRLEYEVFTYHSPEYEDNNWTESEKEFLWHLTGFLKGKDHLYELEYGLLRNFYNIISSHPQVKRLNSALRSMDKRAIEQAWIGIFEANTNNHWFIHTLALLHQEWAEEYERQKDLELASFHWQESRKHWFELYPKKKFWEYFKDNNPEIESRQFSTFVEEFPKRLLAIHQTRLQEYLHQRQQGWAKIHFKCIKLAQGVNDRRINLLANELIENLTSKYLQEAKEKLESDNLSEGIRADYESAINHIKILLELDPNNKRALQFIVEQYNKWGYDLYTLDDKTGLSKLVEKAKPFTKKLANQITKGQGFLRENQIVAENLLIQGYVCDDLQKSIALYKKALKYNPDYDNAKKLLEEAEKAISYETLNKIAEALKYGNFDTAVSYIKSIPSDHEEYDEIMEGMAVIFNNEGLRIAREEGDIDKAIKYLEKAVKLSPYDENLKDNLNALRDQKAWSSYLKQAQEAWEDGDDDKVINCLKKIPSSFAGYKEIKKFLAAAYNRRGVNKANKVLTSIPSDLSDILRIKNELEAAVNDLNAALQYDPYNQQIKDNLNAIKKNLNVFKSISIPRPYSSAGVNPFVKAVKWLANCWYWWIWIPYLFIWLLANILGR